MTIVRKVKDPPLPGRETWIEEVLLVQAKGWFSFPALGQCSVHCCVRGWMHCTQHAVGFIHTLCEKTDLEK